MIRMQQGQIDQIGNGLKDLENQLKIDKEYADTQTIVTQMILQSDYDCNS
jgi:hypothetical protein